MGRYFQFLFSKSIFGVFCWDSLIRDSRVTASTINSEITIHYEFYDHYESMNPLQNYDPLRYWDPLRDCDPLGNCEDNAIQGKILKGDNEQHSSEAIN